jgi:hypothetical protein
MKTPKKFFWPKETHDIVILEPAPKFTAGDRVFIANLNIWGKVSKVFDNATDKTYFLLGTYYSIDIGGGKRIHVAEHMLDHDVLGEIAAL